NRFLVSETVHSDEAKAGLYPHGDHRQRINHAFQCYFAALGAALYREQAKAGGGGPYLSWWTVITSMHPARSCSVRICAELLWSCYPPTTAAWLTAQNQS